MVIIRRVRMFHVYIRKWKLRQCRCTKFFFFQRLCNKICWARTSPKRDTKRKRLSTLFTVGDHLVRSCSIMTGCPKLRARKFLDVVVLSLSSQKLASHSLRAVLVMSFYLAPQLLIVCWLFPLYREVYKHTAEKARKEKKKLIDQKREWRDRIYTNASCD